MLRVLAVFIICLATYIAPIASATEAVHFDYMMNCQGCHLPNGQGFPERGVPSLKGFLGNFLHVDGGREFLVQVPGSALSDLDSARLSAVLNWMLITFSANELPQDFKPYTPDEVARLRQTPLTEVTETRLLLVEAIKSFGSDGQNR